MWRNEEVNLAVFFFFFEKLIKPGWFQEKSCT
jgi:hypothetical protein